MGDPGGIGPEVIVKAITKSAVRRECIPIVVGDVNVMAKACRLVGRAPKIRAIRSVAEAKGTGYIEVIDTGAGTRLSLPETRPTAAGGEVSVAAIRTAVALVMRGHADGMVTAPISKESLKLAGVRWPGHTEMLAHLSRTKRYAMMLTGGPLRVILVTIHVPLRNVPDMIAKGKVTQTIRLARTACDMLGIRDPRIGVAGLNPHAGEAGLFGDEEARHIAPAVRKARREGIDVSGPYPPDTIFYKAYRGEIDIVVCMYHDQGLIPLKMIAFDKGVNVTVGLPFVRTSPDHGTAFDIAWQGRADPSSMIEAILLAARLKVSPSHA